MEKLMTCPSREFLVRQAVLNALASQMPNWVRLEGPAVAAQQLTTIVHMDREDDWFFICVRAEFRTLVSRFSNDNVEELMGALK